MLLLAQEERATIILETSDGPIEVRLSHLDGGQARIGIDAPKNVRIIRKKSAPEQADVRPEAADHGLEDDDWWFHPDEMATAAAPETADTIDRPLSDMDESLP